MTSVAPGPRTTDRPCEWCGGEIPEGKRRDSRFCKQSCRQASHRFQRGCVARGRARRPLRFAYADPPYPGKSRRYYSEHPDFAGEVDHDDLLSHLRDFDGWALSTSARALPRILAMCVAQDLEVRVAAWFRGARHTRSGWPLSCWEPVVFAGGRQLPSRSAGDTRRFDALVKVARARLTDPARVTGAKPADFCWWLFDLLGARPGDELIDLFPGSGGVRRAWDLYGSRSSTNDASVHPGGDASGDVVQDASRRPRRHVSSPAGDDVSRASPSHASRLAAAHSSRTSTDDASSSAAANASRGAADDERAAA